MFILVNILSITVLIHKLYFDYLKYWNICVFANTFNSILLNFQEILFFYNGNFNPKRASIGMKVSFISGFASQIGSLTIYYLIYSYMSNHDNDMLNQSVISRETHQVLTNTISYLNCFRRF
jgi:hypothetical protein